MSVLEKLLKGESLSEEERNTLTPDEIAEARKKELESIEGLRAERRRLEEKKAQEEKNTVTDFSQKFLAEQTIKAENTVFSQLQADGIELTEEKKAAIRETRKKLGGESVSYDGIVDDFLAAAAVIERKNLFEGRRENLEFKKNAAQFISQGAGANGASGPTGENGAKFSQDVWDWVAESRRKGIEITPESAQKVLEGGLKRVYK